MSRPGFSFLLCPDAELLRLRIEDLVQEHGADTTWVRRVYWADEGDLPGAFWQDMSIPDLMGTSRLVVIRRANAFLVDSWNKLSSTLASFNSQIWPIFCLEGGLDKKGNPKTPKTLTKQKYWAVAEKKGWVWSSPGLTRNTLPNFIADYARRNGKDIPIPVRQSLTQLLPLDAVGARNELDKLALAAGDSERITDEHLGIISSEADVDVFSFISMLFSGRSPEKVWKRVFDNRLVSSSDNILFSFLALLQREARILWEMSMGETPSTWVPRNMVGKKQTLARQLGPSRLASVWDLAFEAELGIKSGQRSPEQAFEALIGGLYAVFRDANPSRMR
ncbi:DNA polymerase III subunit delta [Desulfobaculum bizertense]|uniref:DNA polymerase III subunit delta n=1 Tax=Desulfobaculum bizertense TaxID=376490 RepID=UPI001F216DDC|nr:DNA polymerase III subunit delta [Desulfobaculum bizertense]UIJ37640.1 DNA polymerase III subunit delta [Desulfobaculum bizertense]